MFWGGLTGGIVNQLSLKTPVFETLSPRDRPKKPGNRINAGFGFKISTEIVAALVVGVSIGLIVDNYFNTQPFGLIFFFIIGAFAGFLNVYRVIRRIEKKK